MADKRYIDADKLTYSRVRIIHSDGTMGGWNAVVMSSEINNAPAADVVEVRHGEWTLIGNGNGRPIHWKCSVCGYETLDAVNGDTDFCPNCGAKMDGERKEQT